LSVLKTVVILGIQTDQYLGRIRICDRVDKPCPLFPHSNPIDLDLAVRAQALAQLAGVLHDVADVVELELQLAEGQPVEARLDFQVEYVHLCLHLFQDVRKVIQQVRLAVGSQLRHGLLQRDDFVPVLLPGDEIRFRGGEVEVCEEKSMVDDVPEGVGVALY
jgi:hypothetical protein